MTEVVTITEMDVYTLSVVEVPRETPAGVFFGSTQRLEVGGRTFDLVDWSQTEWMDIESGEFVEINWPWSSND